MGDYALSNSVKVVQTRGCFMCSCGDSVVYVNDCSSFSSWPKPYDEPLGWSGGDWFRAFEDLMSAPIDPADYNVSVFYVEPPGRSELQIRLPDDYDEDLVRRICNVITGDVLRNGRSLTFMSEHCNDFKAEMAARVIRTWQARRKGVI